MQTTTCMVTHNIHQQVSTSSCKTFRKFAVTRNIHQYHSECLLHIYKTIKGFCIFSFGEVIQNLYSTIGNQAQDIYCSGQSFYSLCSIFTNKVSLGKTNIFYWKLIDYLILFLLVSLQRQSKCILFYKMTVCSIFVTIPLYCNLSLFPFAKLKNTQQFRVFATILLRNHHIYIDGSAINTFFSKTLFSSNTDIF